MVKEVIKKQESFQIIGISFLVGSIFIIIYSIVYFIFNPLVVHTSIHFIFYGVIGAMLAWGMYLIKNY